MLYSDVSEIEFKLSKSSLVFQDPHLKNKQNCILFACVHILFIVAGFKMHLPEEA